MKILDETAVRNGVLNKRIDRNSIQPVDKKLKASAADARPEQADMQKVQLLLERVASALQSIAERSPPEVTAIEAAATAVSVAMQEATRTIAALAAKRNASHWTFEVQRDAKGLIQSIEARR